MIEHEALPLLPIPGVAPTQPRSVPRTMPVPQRDTIVRGNWVEQENLFRLRDERDRRSTPVGGRDGIAAAFGGELLTATVASGSDTKVAHTLGRVPETIAYVEPSAVAGELLRGATAWDNRFVFVRSTVAGKLYRFCVT